MLVAGNVTLPLASAITPAGSVTWSQSAVGIQAEVPGDTPSHTSSYTIVFDVQPVPETVKGIGAPLALTGTTKGCAAVPVGLVNDPAHAAGACTRSTIAARATAAARRHQRRGWALRGTGAADPDGHEARHLPLVTNEIEDSADEDPALAGLVLGSSRRAVDQVAQVKIAMPGTRGC